MIIYNNKGIYLEFKKKVVTLIKNKIKLKLNNNYNFQKKYKHVMNLLKKEIE